jgi:hypothetical protein
MDEWNNTPVVNDVDDIPLSPLDTTSPHDEFEYELEHLPATTYGLDDPDNKEPVHRPSSARKNEVYTDEAETQEDDHVYEESVMVFMAQEDLIAPLRISRPPNSVHYTPDRFGNVSNNNSPPEHGASHGKTERQKTKHRPETPESSGHEHSHRSSSTKSKKSNKSTVSSRGVKGSDSGMTDVVSKDGKMVFSRKRKGLFGYKVTIG